MKEGSRLLFDKAGRAIEAAQTFELIEQAKEFL